MKNSLPILLLIFVCMAGTGVSRAQTGDYFRDVPIWTDLKEALKTPKAITRLSLAKTKLKEIPLEVFELENLEELDLSRNQIKEIPPQIRRLKKLRILDISRNKLEGFPKEIGELKRLERLEAGRNNIFSLPESIGGCESLEILNLWENNLSSLPESLKKISTLREIDLRIIVFSDATKYILQDMLPGVTIHFSSSCNCGPN